MLLIFTMKLYRAIPKKHKPDIISIQYASPGWIELAVYVATAVSIKKIVEAVTFSFKEINSLYTQIQKDMHARRLMKIEVQHQGFVNWINNTLGVQKTANMLWDTKGSFEFRVFDTPLNFENAIKEKVALANTGRMTGGFCWGWSDPNADLRTRTRSAFSRVGWKKNLSFGTYVWYDGNVKI